MHARIPRKDPREGATVPPKATHLYRVQARDNLPSLSEQCLAWLSLAAECGWVENDHLGGLLRLPTKLGDRYYRSWTPNCTRLFIEEGCNQRRYNDM
jgi:hypothetical protein